MRKHDEAERVAQEHPLISGLPTFLRRQGLSEHKTKYLSRSAFFAYPGTLWLKMAVDLDEADATSSINCRHGLNSEETGNALNVWFRRRREIHNVVFDLRGVTIFDLESWLTLFAKVGIETTKKFFVCQGEIESILRNSAEVGCERVFSSERDLILKLRDIPRNRCCSVLLPGYSRNLMDRRKGKRGGF